MTAATAPNSPDTVTGLLVSQDGPSLTLGLPGTDYRLHLVCDEPVNVAPGRPVRGTIHARARRVDAVTTGGRYIEPVYGRPRRLQGTIVRTDAAANTITVRCACPFICQLVANQRAGDFPIGALVAFDVERGARFQPAADLADNPD